MTESDAYERVEKAVRSIERNLTGAIDPERAADAACFSLYHFHRLFSLATGETPGCYIRKRRLSESARELVLGDRRILEIALSYGFGSQEAFTRAFRRMFGLTPAEYRRAGTLVGCLARWSAPSSDAYGRKEYRMEPRIVRMGERKLIGMAYHGKNENDEIPRFWQKYWDRIAELPNRSRPGESYGFCFSIEGEEGGGFFYLMAVEVSNFDRMPVEMLGKVIPESEYAVFTVRGLAAIKDAYTFAYGEWLPKSGWRHTLNFDYEFYGTKFANPDDPNAEFEICIPVVKAMA